MAQYHNDTIVGMPKRKVWTDSERLAYLMKQKDVSVAEVAAGTELERTNLHAVLSGSRNLSRSQISALAKFFNTPSEILGL